MKNHDAVHVMHEWDISRIRNGAAVPSFIMRCSGMESFFAMMQQPTGLLNNAPKLLQATGLGCNAKWSCSKAVSATADLLISTSALS